MQERQMKNPSANLLDGLSLWGSVSHFLIALVSGQFDHSIDLVPIVTVPRQFLLDEGLYPEHALGVRELGCIEASCPDHH